MHVPPCVPRQPVGQSLGASFTHLAPPWLVTPTSPLGQSVGGGITTSAGAVLGAASAARARASAKTAEVRGWVATGRASHIKASPGQPCAQGTRRALAPTHGQTAS